MNKKSQRHIGFILLAIITLGLSSCEWIASLDQSGSETDGIFFYTKVAQETVQVRQAQSTGNSQATQDNQATLIAQDKQNLLETQIAQGTIWPTIDVNGENLPPPNLAATQEFQAALATQEMINASLTQSAQPTTLPPPDLIWYATHEGRNISEWKQHGDFLRQGSSGNYELVTNPVHGGKYAVALSIDTKSQSDTGAHAAYLFYWDELPDEADYYSAWYYIPSNINPGSWWNIWQWKSTFNHNSDLSKPMWSLDVGSGYNGFSVILMYRPDLDNEKVTYKNNDIVLPKDTWFQIEGYFKKAVDKTGQVIIWLDGKEIFNVDNVVTVLGDRTVHWSINNYADDISPSPATIYVDDAAISWTRIGTNWLLPE